MPERPSAPPPTEPDRAPAPSEPAGEGGAPEAEHDSLLRRRVWLRIAERLWSDRVVIPLRRPGSPGGR